MTAILGTVLLGVVIVMSILIICGAPLGEFTMGGKYKVYPKKMRIVLVSQLFLQIFFAVILLQLGGKVPLMFTQNVTKIIGYVLSIYLSLNSLMNFASKSKKEKYLMTPLSAVTAVCFWINTIGF